MEILGGRRSRIELVASILKAAIQAERKTRIIHKSNLDTRIARSLLPALEELGLIERNEATRHQVYRVTAKGLEFLKHYENIVRLLRLDAYRRKHVP